jgi:hypothetical protein
MSEYSQWKMLHLLYGSQRPSLTYGELKAAGVDCYNDTIMVLQGMGIVSEFAPQQYSLAPVAAAMLNTFVITQRRWQGPDIRVDYPQAFVIMPFSQPWSAAVYEQMIQPAVEAAGLVCVRGDGLVRAGDLMQTVWGALLVSGVMIADVSAINANVFYELGLAHALGKATFVLKQRDSQMPADFGGTHYHEYDVADLAAGKAMLEAELVQWKADSHADGVKALYA